MYPGMPGFGVQRVTSNQTQQAGLWFEGIASLKPNDLEIRCANSLTLGIALLVEYMTMGKGRTKSVDTGSAEKPQSALMSNAATAKNRFIM